MNGSAEARMWCGCAIFERIVAVWMELPLTSAASSWRGDTRTRLSRGETVSGAQKALLIGKGTGKEEADAPRISDDHRANLEQAAA